MKTTEAQTLKAIKQYLAILEKQGRLWWSRLQSGVVPMSYKGKQRFIHAGRPGSPDLIVLYKGKLYAFEVKSSSGNLSPKQAEVGERITRSGGVYSAVRSLDDVEKLLGVQ